MLKWIAATFLSMAPLSATIVSEPIHITNQQILGHVIDEEAPSSLSSEERADILLRKLPSIATKALARGFDTSAYAATENEDGDLAFVSIPIWEGKTVPMTLYVYVWPSEGAALEYAPYSLKNNAYRSGIHTHSIPFSLTPLTGKIQQTRYRKGKDGLPKVIRKRQMSIGEVTVDDLSEPFMHEMAVTGSSARPTVTLNAFGAPTAQAVAKSFKEKPKKS